MTRVTNCPVTEITKHIWLLWLPEGLNQNNDDITKITRITEIIRITKNWLWDITNITTMTEITK